MENTGKFDSEITVEDGDDYGGAEALGIKAIALDQYRRCCIEGSKEMRKGGISTKLIRGVPVQIEVPDQREIFVNCVKLLEIVLAPELFKKTTKYNTVDFLGMIHKLDEKIEELVNTSKETYEDCLNTHGKNKRGNPDKYTQESLNDSISRINNETDKKMVTLFQEKLVILSRQLDQLNYFDEGSAYGG